MHQDHFVYRPDSTKVGKTIAMFLGGKLLGPDWSRYAVHHYAVKNNAVEGVSRIQLQGEHDTCLRSELPYLEVIEPGGVIQPKNIIELYLYLNDKQNTIAWLVLRRWDEFDMDDVEEVWKRLRLTGRDAKLCSDDALLHPDNRC